jgi:hypothetical protein
MIVFPDVTRSMARLVRFRIDGGKTFQEFRRDLLGKSFRLAVPLGKACARARSTRRCLDARVGPTPRIPSCVSGFSA